MTRRKSREQAFKLLFAISFHRQTELEEIITLGLEQDFIEQDEYSLLLARTAWDKLPEIDKFIEEHSIGWKKKRLSRVTLAMLRLAITEMHYFNDVPVSVSINEAIELCKEYGSSDEASFLNGVLGGVARADAQGESE